MGNLKYFKWNLKSRILILPVSQEKMAKIRLTQWK